MARKRLAVLPNASVRTLRWAPSLLGLFEKSADDGSSTNTFSAVCETED